MGFSKATQVEHGICSDRLTVQEFSYAKEARVEEIPKRQKGTKERVAKLQLQLDLVNQKLTNLYGSEELLEMIESVQTGWNPDWIS